MHFIKYKINKPSVQLKWDKDKNFFSLLQRNLVRQAQNMNRTVFLMKKSITALQIIVLETYHTVKRV
jgi:hypothetical protein